MPSSPRCITISFDITRGEVTARTHSRLVRESLEAASKHHVAFNLPRHFEINNSTRPGGPYGYHRRSRGWLERKQRMYGHQIPNVATGAMKASIVGGARITATQYRSQIYLRNYFALTPERWREITAITPGEFRQLKQLAIRHYREQAKQNKAKRRTRITA